MTIKDSGARHEYSTGAVRDIQEGKGRCDLMPLQIIGEWLQDDVIEEIGKFMNTGDIDHLYDALSWSVTNNDPYQVAIELSKHFEAGAKKYGERNWEKGIPVDSYIDSAIRHYLKWNVGYEDEDHFIAFIWNVVCAIWTVTEEHITANDPVKDWFKNWSGSDGKEKLLGMSTNTVYSIFTTWCRHEDCSNPYKRTTEFTKYIKKLTGFDTKERRKEDQKNKKEYVYTLPVMRQR